MIRVVAIAGAVLLAFFFLIAPDEKREMTVAEKKPIDMSEREWAEIATKLGSQATAAELVGGEPSPAFRTALERFGVDPDDFQARARDIYDSHGRRALEERDAALQKAKSMATPACGRYEAARSRYEAARSSPPPAAAAG